MNKTQETAKKKESLAMSGVGLGAVIGVAVGTAIINGDSQNQEPEIVPEPENEPAVEPEDIVPVVTDVPEKTQEHETVNELIQDPVKQPAKVAAEMPTHDNPSIHDEEILIDAQPLVIPNDDEYALVNPCHHQEEVIFVEEQGEIIDEDVPLIAYEEEVMEQSGDDMMAANGFDSDFIDETDHSFMGDDDTVLLASRDMNEMDNGIAPEDTELEDIALDIHDLQ